MRKLARSIAVSIKKADTHHTHSIEVMEYSLTILLNTFFIIISTILIGWLTDELSSTIIALSSVLIIRVVSGGPHIKSMWGCNLFSIILCATIPHLPLVVPLVVLNTISAILMLVFAPRPDKNTKMPDKLFPYLKVISVALVCSNFFMKNDVIGLVFFIQALTIIPLRREGGV